MSIDDLNLPWDVSHDREVEAWADRSIPGRELSTRDLMRRQRADDLEAQRLRHEERALCESEAAMASHWSGIFAHQAKDRPAEQYPETRRGYDRRLFGP